MGFTLLELLIAMTLMGMILVMVYGGLRLGMRSWEAGQVRVEAVDDMRLVQEFIRRQLRQTVVTFRSDGFGERVVAFEGDAAQLNLVAPMLAYLGLGGLYFIQFDVIQENETDHLRVRWWPFRADGFEDDDESEESILLSDVSDFEWSYFGSEESGQDPEWYQRWESQTQYPRLVRLRLDVGGEPWPDLVVAISTN